MDYPVSMCPNCRFQIPIDLNRLQIYCIYCGYPVRFDNKSTVQPQINGIQSVPNNVRPNQEPQKKIENSEEVIILQGQTVDIKVYIPRLSNDGGLYFDGQKISDLSNTTLQLKVHEGNHVLKYRIGNKTCSIPARFYQGGGYTFTENREGILGGFEHKG